MYLFTFPTSKVEQQCLNCNNLLLHGKWKIRAETDHCKVAVDGMKHFINFSLQPLCAKSDLSQFVIIKT
jgi:hypothetical protein